MTIPVILDVDTGVDDALALLFAARHPGLDLRAVTCVAGNVGVDKVVANTLTVLDTAGRGDVPVARGAARPLVAAPRPDRVVHGRDGMADLGWPPSTRTVDPRHAVELLRDELTAGPPVTLVALAPLTNIALLLRTYPETAEHIERFVFVGGTTTDAVEFNVGHDPESAAIVLDALAASSTPVTMYGLDVFYDPAPTESDAALLDAGTDPGAQLAAGLLRFGIARYQTGVTTIGDAGAVCAVVEPAGLHTERRAVRVELSGMRGRTLVDPGGDHPAVIDVALDVDGARYVDLWRTVVGGTVEP
jgi:pyrimidine-specific ribonucleoside hydrolase